MNAAHLIPDAFVPLVGAVLPSELLCLNDKPPGQPCDTQGQCVNTKSSSRAPSQPAPPLICGIQSLSLYLIQRMRVHKLGCRARPVWGVGGPAANVGTRLMMINAVMVL